MRISGSFINGFAYLYGSWFLHSSGRDGHLHRPVKPCLSIAWVTTSEHLMFVVRGGPIKLEGAFF